ncbi:MAG: hypothetical protein ISR65_11075 [Bacteriovoracaceae bacterium]|nr:hypothetical protein [Bacteriovoracaceae bacterium]
MFNKLHYIYLAYLAIMLAQCSVVYANPTKATLRRRDDTNAYQSLIYIQNYVNKKEDEVNWSLIFTIALSATTCGAALHQFMKGFKTSNKVKGLSQKRKDTQLILDKRPRPLVQQIINKDVSKQQASFWQSVMRQSTATEMEFDETLAQTRSLRQSGIALTVTSALLLGISGVYHLNMDYRYSWHDLIEDQLILGGKNEASSLSFLDSKQDFLDFLKLPPKQAALHMQKDDQLSLTVIRISNALKKARR